MYRVFISSLCSMSWGFIRGSLSCFSCSRGSRREANAGWSLTDRCHSRYSTEEQDVWQEVDEITVPNDEREQGSEKVKKKAKDRVVKEEKSKKGDLKREHKLTVNVNNTRKKRKRRDLWTKTTNRGQWKKKKIKLRERQKRKTNKWGQKWTKCNKNKRRGGIWRGSEKQWAWERQKREKGDGGNKLTTLTFPYFSPSQAHTLTVPQSPTAP